MGNLLDVAQLVEGIEKGFRYTPGKALTLKSSTVFPEEIDQGYGVLYRQRLLELYLQSFFFNLKIIYMHTI